MFLVRLCAHTHHQLRGVALRQPGLLAVHRLQVGDPGSPGDVGGDQQRAGNRAVQHRSDHHHARDGEHEPGVQRNLR
jgi:hypothetical protein